MRKDKSIHDLRYRSLIEALANERKRLNISQAELADHIGLSQSDISKIELLERRLDVLEFASILEAFRVGENKTLSDMVASFLGLPSP
jgi:transcriptional regulator with XRE-family HTH domain